MKHLDPDSRVAPYLQIAEALRQAIRDGEYQPGDRLPSRVQLADHFGCAPMTATAAMRILHDEGVITARQGSSTQVRAVPAAPEEPAAPEAPRDFGAEIDELRAEITELRARFERPESR